MSFEAPIQPVLGPRRSAGPGIAVTVVAVALIALLVWRPWSDRGPGGGPGAAGPEALATLTPIPTRSSTPSPAATSLLYANPPSADAFAPTWSIVGVREVPGGGSLIDQLPLEPRAAARAGTLAFATCDLNPAPDVAFMWASTFLLLGVVVPHAGRGWIRLSLIDGSMARAFAVLVTYPPGTEDLAVGLFGVSALSLWPRGGYRFYAVDDTGVGRYLYACLGG
jgi:hypothetical protein